jgi:hypothetical protein
MFPDIRRIDFDILWVSVGCFHENNSTDTVEFWQSIEELLVGLLEQQGCRNQIRLPRNDHGPFAQCVLPWQVDPPSRRCRVELGPHDFRLKQAVNRPGTLQRSQSILSENENSAASSIIRVFEDFWPMSCWRETDGSRKCRVRTDQDSLGSQVAASSKTSASVAYQCMGTEREVGKNRTTRCRSQCRHGNTWAILCSGKGFTSMNVIFMSVKPIKRSCPLLSKCHAWKEWTFIYWSKSSWIWIGSIQWRDRRFSPKFGNSDISQFLYWWEFAQACQFLPQPQWAWISQ